MSPTNTLKKIAKAIAFLAMWLGINGIYFEYCISRSDIPLSLTYILAPILLGANIYAVIASVKFLTRLLRF